MDTVASIDLSVPGSPSLIMRDLSEYTILAFLAAFDVPSTTTTSTPKKRVTYIALTKRTMPMLVDLFVRYKTSREIYVDGTLESVLASYAIPVKLKYDCPSASKYDTAKVLPLWKTATECFLKIVKEVSSNIGALSEDSGIPDERVEGIWRQVLDVYRGGILADWYALRSFNLPLTHINPSSVLLLWLSHFPFNLRKKALIWHSSHHLKLMSFPILGIQDFQTR